MCTHREAKEKNKNGGFEDRIYFPIIHQLMGPLIHSTRGLTAASKNVVEKSFRDP